MRRRLFGRRPRHLAHLNPAVTVAFCLRRNFPRSRLAGNLCDRLHRQVVPIAHLKLSLTDETGQTAGSVSVTRSDGPVETTLAPERTAAPRTLAINLRAEAAPTRLSREVEAAVGALRDRLRLDDARAFRPGRPQPTHRLRQV